MTDEATRLLQRAYDCLEYVHRQAPTLVGYGVRAELANAISDYLLAAPVAQVLASDYESLRAECDALRADAERWRMLHDGCADPEIYDCVFEAAQLIAYKCQCSIALSESASATDMLDAAIAAAPRKEGERT